MAVNLQKGQKIDLSKSSLGAAQTSAVVTPSSSKKPVRPILIAIGIIILFALAFLLITRQFNSGNKPPTGTELSQVPASQSASTGSEVTQEPAPQSVSLGTEVTQIPTPASTGTDLAQTPVPQPASTGSALTQTSVLQPAFVEIGRVIFLPNTSDLLPNVGVWFDEFANSIKRELEQSPERMFQITGYSAIVPGPPEPVTLSLERARKARDELVKRNIPAHKFEIKGAGETSFFGNSREENRRIKITILGSEGAR